MTAPDLAQRSRAAVWHPCTQMARLADVPPLPIARGEGPWLIDTDGRRYFDANSSWWVNLFGHSDRALHDAIKAQLDTLPHVMLAGCTHEPAVRLAERLSARTGGALGHVFFGSDGASAVEIALKHSYHGETLGALSVTDVQVFRDAYDPLLMRAHIVATPDGRLGNEAEALAAIRALLAERHAQIACVIVEPLIQGAAGMVMYSPEYLRGLRALTREFGVHLIADEIAVGCGRTGTFFAWEQTGADWPDFLLLSKGITGGTMALSLVLTTDEVFESFWSADVTRGFLHSHSYTGNPLACAAANAVLDRFDAGQLADNRAQAERLTRAFAPLAGRVAHLRQRGMILAFDVPDAPPRFAETFHLAARAHARLIRPIGSTVYLMPPYLIDDTTAAFLAQAVTATLNDVLA